MPLPDERPRASVANLIGRFEQRQNKRQSMTGSPTPSPSVSRSTSVVSNHTGDSAAIEAKERREWPPKLQGNTTTATSPSASDTSNAINFADLRRSLSPPVTSTPERASLVSPPPDASSDPSPQSLSASVESILQAVSPEPVATSDPAAESAPEPEAEKAEAPKKASARAPGKIAPSKSTPASTNAPSRAAAARGTTPRPSATAQSKPTPSTPAKGAPAAKPLKAQNTGASTVSSSARTARLGAKSPPARSKTPSGLRASSSAPKAGPARSKTPTPSTSGAARPKTPSAPAAGAARPKTPSGLYAPTKASLARARNAEAPPAPVRKTTVTTSALERLTKPTAASASKARPPVASPPRPTAAKTTKTTRGVAPTRGATVKPRVGLAPARMKADREKKEKEAAAKKAAPLSGDETADHSAASEHTPSNASEDEFGHKTSSDAHLSHPYSENEPPSDIESYDDAFASDGDDHLLDSSHIQSALPREEGELAPFAMTPESSGNLELEVEHDEPELPVEEAKEEVVEEVPASESEKEEEAESKPEAEEEASELGVKLEAVANGTSTPTAAAFNNGGASASDDFDNVLDMLSVKPAVRTPSPSSDVVAVAGEIPDEE